MRVQCKSCGNKEWLATDAVAKDEVLNSLRYTNEVMKCCQNPDYKRINAKNNT